MSERMKERKRLEGGWTITPEVPSIELTSKVYELKIDNYKGDEEFTPQMHLMILWVNRHNQTIGVVVEDD